jgi:hypothetical protein
MSNVYEFKRGKGSDSAARGIMSALPRTKKDEGSMLFTIDGDESEMKITGVYEERLQLGVYTIVQGLKAMVDRLAASGEVGHYSAGPIDEPLPFPTKPPRGLPKRLRESTGFGELK